MSGRWHSDQTDHETLIHQCGLVMQSGVHVRWCMRQGHAHALTSGMKALLGLQRLQVDDEGADPRTQASVSLSGTASGMLLLGFRAVRPLANFRSAIHVR